MFTFLRNLTVLAIMITVGATSGWATIAVEVYTFTGTCTDCTGDGTGTLILYAGYVPGTALAADDLYSFNYSSNLIPDLSIFNDPTEDITGTLPIGSGPADIVISGANGTFTTSTDGDWSAIDDDSGTDGIWSSSSVTSTPEPSALPAIGMCLAGVVFLRGRRRKAS